MNESEIRRRELLRQTRKLYNEEHHLPLVHPRYGNYRDEFYAEEEEYLEGGSFLFRLGLGILAFICFVWMDYKGLKVSDVSSEQIVEHIEKQMDLEELEELWREL